MSTIEGKSGTTHGRRRRTGEDRLQAIPGVLESADAFRARIKDAEGDAARLADLMAEAIAMDRSARALESVSKDGRQTFAMERLAACWCMDDARTAYLKARGSNQASDTEQSQ